MGPMEMTRLDFSVALVIVSLGSRVEVLGSKP